jgi:hypothetical protein
MSYAQPSAAHTARHGSANLSRRATTASAPGNATEWFDYGIYAYDLTYVSAFASWNRPTKRDSTQTFP